jgi:5-formyltetrahydrofolate cyclo-ligase
MLLQGYRVMTKKEIRLYMLDLRTKHAVKDKKQRDQNLIEQIKNHPFYQQAKTVTIFYPMKGEIDLLKLLKDDKVFLFPRVNKEHLDFYQYRPFIPFHKSSFGVMEPSDKEPKYEGSYDLAIVPALAISKEKDRIGYGKGFYDKFISTHDIKHTLGVIYDFQELDHIDASSFDQKLDDYIKGSL